MLQLMVNSHSSDLNIVESNYLPMLWAKTENKGKN